MNEKLFKKNENNSAVLGIVHTQTLILFDFDLNLNKKNEKTDGSWNLIILTHHSKTCTENVNKYVRIKKVNNRFYGVMKWVVNFCEK